MVMKVYEFHSEDYPAKIHYKVKFLLHVYKENITISSYKRNMLCQRFANYTDIIFKVGVTLYFSALGLYLIYPAYMFFIENEIALFVPIYIPTLDESTLIGYGILSAYHLTIMIFGTAAGAASDFLHITIITNVPVLAEIFAESVEDLNELLMKKKKDLPMCHSKFKNIILLHRELQEYVILFT